METRRILFWLTLFGVMGARVARADWDDEFVQRLRDRRLFEIAEDVCRERFGVADSPREAAHWVVEGMRTAAAAALQKPTHESQPIWAQIGAEWVEPFRARYGDSPWRHQVVLQEALNELAWGEALRRESEVASESAALRSSALEHLRGAERSLRALLNALEQPLPPNSTMKPAVVQGLHNQAMLALAKVYWNRALSYPAGSDDRIAALESAKRRIDALLQQTRPEELLQAEALLWQVRCLRGLDDLAAANRALQLLNRRKDLPPTFQLERDAEALRLAQAAHGQLPMEPVIGRSIAGVRSPEWDLAALDVWLDRLALSGSSEAEEIQRTIEQGIASIETVHGPYYGRLATQLMVRRIGHATSVASAGLLERSARERLGEKRWREAADLLRQAAEAASRGGNAAEAFRFAYQAALVEQQSGDHEAAAQHLRDLSLRWRKDPRAPQAHLLAIWEWQQAAMTSDDPTLLAWLDEQLHEWPSDPATSRARIWLARWLRLKDNPQEALEVLKQVDWASAAARDALDEVFALWSVLLERTAKKDELLERLDAYFDELLKALPGMPPPAIKPRMQRYHWQLRAVAGQQLSAEQQAALRRWLDDSPSRDELPHLLVVAVLLADTPVKLPPDADWRGLSFDQVRWLAIAWRRWLERFPQRAQDRAKLVASLIDLWLEAREKVTPAQALFLKTAAAEAYGVGGDRQRARQRFETLLAQHRSDVALRRAWARFLLSGSSSSDWAQAERSWRELGSAAKPGSVLWYESKYGVAKALLLQGKRRECRDRLAYLRATRGFGESPWRERLEELWRQCQ